MEMERHSEQWGDSIFNYLPGGHTNNSIKLGGYHHYAMFEVGQSQSQFRIGCEAQAHALEFLTSKVDLAEVLDDERMGDQKVSYL